MPYIPQFNKLSLNEMAYAPSLLRQQHDDAVAKQMELAEALKFDYLKQDAPGIEPVLQQYNTDIEDVSNQIAQQGFTQDIKNKVLGLRSKFVTDDKIRQYKKNYSDAMTGWEDLKKRMIQEGRPGDDINRQKAAYFSGYKGAFDNEGFKQEFTPGRTSGYYDIAEDAKKAMTNLGTTGMVVGKSGTSITEKTGIGADKKPFTYFEVTDSKTGQKLTNLDQRQAVERYLMSEYGDNTTDRGLFAQISGITPEHIRNTITNVSQSMAENRYAQLPQTDTNISGMARGKVGGDNAFGAGYLRQSGTGLVPPYVNDLGNRVYKDLGDRLAKDEANKLGLTGITSLEDLKKAAGLNLDDTQPSVSPEGIFVGTERTKYKQPSKQSVAAQKALEAIDLRLKNKSEGTALPTYEINPLMLASHKSITEAEGLQKGMDQYISRHIERFTPIDGDKEDLEGLKDITITDFSPNFKEREAGVVLYLSGKDKKDNPKKIAVTLDPQDTNTEEALVGYLAQMNPIIAIEYQYGKLSSSDKKEYLKALEASIPSSESMEEAQSKVDFINSKRVYNQ